MPNPKPGVAPSIKYPPRPSRLYSGILHREAHRGDAELIGPACLCGLCAFAVNIGIARRTAEAQRAQSSAGDCLTLRKRNWILAGLTCH